MVTTKQRQTRKAGWVRGTTERPFASLRFARSRSDALIAGVAGGLAERWGVDPVLVRIAFIVSSFAGAVGVIAYLAAWSVSLDPGDRRAPAPREPSSAQDAAFGSIAAGVVIVMHGAGLWLGEPLFIPLLVGASGAALVYVGAGRDRRPRWARAALMRETPTGRPSLVHVAFGGVFVVGGVVWFLTANSFNGLLGVMIAVAVTAMGLAIVFGPWVYRMANQLGEERLDRIRSEERAELAAHLHDSVLQTLALIQRNAGRPRKMASLARRQERELRAWLYGQQQVSGRLGAAVQQMADGVEEAHEVTVTTVLVGDCVLDERTSAVVQACREAANNAAKHSGADEISIYIECEDAVLTAYVRDRGKGFDVETVSEDGRGIADSIRGRIARQGGTVNITTSPGDGCEVAITMPLTTGGARGATPSGPGRLEQP